MDRILDFISDYALSLKYQNLPHNVLHQVRRRVIDTLGCAMGGYEMGPPSMARAHALEVESTPGSTILGTRQRSAPPRNPRLSAGAARRDSVCCP